MHDLDQRPEGVVWSAPREGASARHAHIRATGTGQRLDECGLADAGLSGDECQPQPSAASPIELAGERREFL